MKLLTNITILNDSSGEKRISYTYNLYNDDGSIKKENVKESYIVLDNLTKNIINELEIKINEKMVI